MHLQAIHRNYGNAKGLPSHAWKFEALYLHPDQWALTSFSPHLVGITSLLYRTFGWIKNTVCRGYMTVICIPLVAPLIIPVCLFANIEDAVLVVFILPKY